MQALGALLHLVFDGLALGERPKPAFEITHSIGATPGVGASPASSVTGSRTVAALAWRALLPVREVFGQAGAELLGARRLAVDLDQAHVARDPAQQAQPFARRPARRIGLVPEIGVLGCGSSSSS